MPVAPNVPSPPGATFCAAFVPLPTVLILLNADADGASRTGVPTLGVTGVLDLGATSDENMPLAGGEDVIIGTSGLEGPASGVDNAVGLRTREAPRILSATA